MARATAREVFERLRETLRGRRDAILVHRSRRNVVRGRPGHYYWVPGEPSDEEMARTSALSGNAEAALLKINDAFFIKIGNRGVAIMDIPNPPREQESDDQAILDYRLINHTHPLEQETDENRVPRGPSQKDWEALEALSQNWGQTSSYIIICRGGRVVETRDFEVQPQAIAPDGRIWSPSR